MMIPYQALLTPLYLDFAKLGLVDSRIGLAIVHTILQLPFSVYLMRNAFEAIPREIEEAAMIDGCSALRRLTHIFLPLACRGSSPSRCSPSSTRGTSFSPRWCS